MIGGTASGSIAADFQKVAACASGSASRRPIIKRQIITLVIILVDIFAPIRLNFSNMSIQSLTATQLRQAADLKEKIESLQKKLAALLPGNEISASKAAVPAKKKRGMSAAGRARVSAAAKKRWAKIKAAKLSVKPAAKPAPKMRRKMSAAAKAKLSKLAKERWAKAKATGKKKL